MRLDHLLSKEEEVEYRRCVLLLSYQGKLNNNISGSDAVGGHTRSHPEHDGKDPIGRWYCTGDGVGEQVTARSNGDVAQLGEHLPCKQGVESSNLFISTEIERFQDGLIAQLVRAHA